MRYVKTPPLSKCRGKLLNGATGGRVGGRRRVYAPYRPALPRMTETPFLLKLEDLIPQFYGLQGSNVPRRRVETSLRNDIFNNAVRFAIASSMPQISGDFPIALLNTISKCRSLRELSSVIMETYC
jgi:hypothetical protein